MTIKEIVQTAIKSRGYTQATFAPEIGTTPSALSDRLNRGTMNLKKFMTIMDKLGYEIVIKDKRNGSKAGTMVLDSIDNEE